MKKPVIKMTVFYRPNGNNESNDVTNIYPDDEKYVRKHNIKLSMEFAGHAGTFMYFDDGTLDEDGEEPDEIIVISKTKSAKDMIKEGIELIKKRKNGSD